MLTDFVTTVTTVTTATSEHHVAVGSFTTVAWQRAPERACSRLQSKECDGFFACVLLHLCVAETILFNYFLRRKKKKKKKKDDEKSKE